MPFEPALWGPRELSRLKESPLTTAPPAPDAMPRVLPGHYLWDMWPVQDLDGSPVVVMREEIWIALTAPRHGHPEDRHDVARLRLLAGSEAGWRDLGAAFAPGASPGSREWSGSAVRRDDGSVSVYYTATGERGEPRLSYRQRVVEVRTRLLTDDGVRLAADAQHRELMGADGSRYVLTDQSVGGPGRIRAFRDPWWFRDPADGRDYLLIAASVSVAGECSGAIAIASHSAGGWTLEDPLMRAIGINHEIERPHLIARDGRYYLFYCTQWHTFHPPDAGPTGLYGFVAPRLGGPWEPLNRSGLVIRNPPGQPDQAYAWLVLPDLRVVSFLNYRSPGGADPRRASSAAARAAFGGTVAPVLQLTLDGATTSVALAEPTVTP
jgi:levansucrase